MPTSGATTRSPGPLVRRPHTFAGLRYAVWPARVVDVGGRFGIDTVDIGAIDDQQFGKAMAKPVRARRLTDAEGQTLQRIVRRGKHDSLRVRRALIVMAFASGTTVQAIAGLVQAEEDTVREVIHRFNQVGLGALDPQWSGGRPRLISAEDEAFIVQTATTPTTPCWPVSSRATCAGATPTRATLTCWPPNAASPPASAANHSAAGIAPRGQQCDDQPGVRLVGALEPEQ